MSATVHVTPADDLYPHVDHAGCPCVPSIEESGKLVLHRSWDGREAYEEEIHLPMVEYVAPGDVQ